MKFSRARPLPTHNAVARACIAALLTLLSTQISVEPDRDAPRSPYTFDGLPIWVANDWYTTNLETGGSSYAVNTVDPNSANILENFARAFPGLVFRINGSARSVSQGTPVNTFSGAIPQYPVNGCTYGCLNDPYNDGTSPWSIPWQPSFLEQGSCDAGDCHNIVLNITAGVEWETYTSGRRSWDGSRYSAESGSIHNVRQSLNSQLTNGPDAAGLPLMGASLWGEDAAQYSINHIIAISIAGTDREPRASGGFVIPATAGNACSRDCTYTLPMGARLRLNSTKYTCPSAAYYPQANRICMTMQTYGVIVLDHNGTNSSYGPGLQPKSDGTNPWNQTDAQQLDGIPITDFDVMALGKIH